MLNKITAITDKELVIELKNGNQFAFDTLYNIYKDKIIFFATKFIKSREIAEDIYHDVFTQIWINKESLDESKSFSSFIYLLIKNRLLDEIRKQLQDQKFRESLISEPTLNDTLDGILREDFDKLYKDSLNRLTSKQRIIFSMSRDEYKTYKEIAEQLNISINTVKSHLSQATNSMRSFIAKFIIH